MPQINLFYSILSFCTSAATLVFNFPIDPPPIVKNIYLSSLLALSFFQLHTDFFFHIPWKKILLNGPRRSSTNLGSNCAYLCCPPPPQHLFFTIFFHVKR